MYCQKCGTKIPNNSQYCYKCGQKLPTYNHEENFTEEEPTIKSTTLEKIKMPTISAPQIDSPLIRGLKDEFSFNGRRSRSNFLGMTVFLNIVQYNLNIFVMKGANLDILIFIEILALWLTCVNYTKRCHDLNYKGYLALCPLTSYVVQVIFGISFVTHLALSVMPELFLLVKKGTKDSNQYGAAPV